MAVKPSIHIEIIIAGLKSLDWRVVFQQKIARGGGHTEVKYTLLEIPPDEKYREFALQHILTGQDHYTKLLEAIETMALYRKRACRGGKKAGRMWNMALDQFKGEVGMLIIKLESGSYLLDHSYCQLCEEWQIRFDGKYVNEKQRKEVRRILKVVWDMKFPRGNTCA